VDRPVARLPWYVLICRRCRHQGHVSAASRSGSQSDRGELPRDPRLLCSPCWVVWERGRTYICTRMCVCVGDSGQPEERTGSRGDGIKYVVSPVRGQWDQSVDIIYKRSSKDADLGVDLGTTSYYPSPPGTQSLTTPVPRERWHFRRRV